MKIKQILEYNLIGVSKPVFGSRPMAHRIYFYELPQPVQQAVLDRVEYEDIESVKKWFDGYFIKTHEGIEYGFNEDGSLWQGVDEDQPVATTTHRMKGE